MQKSRPSTTAKAWADKLAAWLFPTNDQAPWRAEFVKRFAVVDDDSFSYFCDTGTEVVTRVRIDEEKKSVAKGALWTEELLPAEAILAGVVWCDKVYHQKDTITPTQIMDAYCKEELALQMGGKATVGRGQVRTVFTLLTGTVTTVTTGGAK